MFHFDSPWFIFLLPLPFVIRKYAPSSKTADSGANLTEIYFPHLQRLKHAFPTNSFKTQSNRTFFAFMIPSWFLLVLALMQPEFVDQFRQVKNQGHDLMLAVDLSASMQAVDFSTQFKTLSRLDATKEVVSKFALGRQGDRLGLVAFGEKAYLHVPLTLDTVSVSRMLNDTVSGMAGNATAIGDAIGMSVRVLRERPAGSRVLILLTDGEDNSSSIPPMEAAKLAKQYGVRIYTIGVGRNGLVPFPTKYGGYGMAEVSIDEHLLKEIAALTGGQYFHASDQSGLEKIYNKIDALEKTEANETLFLIREPLFYYPLILSMVLFLLVSLYPLMNRRGANGS